MLTHLSVQNFAIVDQLDLELASGMNVVTGETGAGKSILLDALGLTLGNRSDAEFVAPGADRAEVTATFETNAKAVRSWLETRELAQSEGEVILRRTISQDGRSRAFINGVPTTVAELRLLGDLLIDLHAQHEHQSLLKLETHRRLLDEYGGHDALATSVESASSACQSAVARRNELVARAAAQSAERQLLAYQAEELADLALGDGECELLEVTQKELESAGTVLEASQRVLDTLAESEHAINNVLQHAVTELVNLDQPRLAPVTELLESGRIQLDEAANDLGRFVTGLQIDPARLREVEARLDQIYAIARKHRCNPPELAERQANINEQLEALANAEAGVAELDEQIAALKATYQRDAMSLSKKRKKAAKTLHADVEVLLKELGMRETRFEVFLGTRADDTPHPAGMEQIEFLISTNPGHPPRALARIASGGELSRISLAIQVATSQTSEVPTLIFDEVDVGIGGATADTVGKLVRQLGARAQIICVTHLPQVAAHGHAHYLVSKDDQTRITLLEEKGRTREIARMLGGTQTKKSTAHAREILDAARAG